MRISSELIIRYGTVISLEEAKGEDGGIAGKADLNERKRDSGVRPSSDQRIR